MMSQNAASEVGQRIVAKAGGEPRVETWLEKHYQPSTLQVQVKGNSSLLKLEPGLLGQNSNKNLVHTILSLE